MGFCHTSSCIIWFRDSDGDDPTLAGLGCGAGGGAGLGEGDVVELAVGANVGFCKLLNASSFRCFSNRSHRVTRILILSFRSFILRSGVASFARHASRSTRRFSLAKSSGDNASVGVGLCLVLTLGLGGGGGFGGVTTTLATEEGRDVVTQVPRVVDFST